MAGQKLKKHGWAKADKNKAGQKLKKQGCAKAEKTSGDHILTGGLGPPFNTWWSLAAAPCGDSICGLRLYFQLLPNLVFSAFAQPCFFSFCPAIYFQLLPSHVFSAFAQPCIFSCCPTCFSARLLFQLSCREICDLIT